MQAADGSGLIHATFVMGLCESVCCVFVCVCVRSLPTHTVVCGNIKGLGLGRRFEKRLHIAGMIM